MPRFRCTSWFFMTKVIWPSNSEEQSSLSVVESLTDNIPDYLVGFQKFLCSARQPSCPTLHKPHKQLCMSGMFTSFVCLKPPSQLPCLGGLLSVFQCS